MKERESQVCKKKEKVQCKVERTNEQDGEDEQWSMRMMRAVGLKA